MNKRTVGLNDGWSKDLIRWEKESEILGKAKKQLDEKINEEKKKHDKNIAKC